MNNFVLILLLLFSHQLQAQNVLYGERDLQEEKLALYFDKDGFPYPDYKIPDSSMRAAYGSLFTFFLQNAPDFIAVSAKYELFPEKIDSETIYLLRDSINAVNARKINAVAGSSTVSFYIHGYRKAFVPQNGDVTSVEEFQLLKDNLATYRAQRPVEVEVYWDGMYDCCFSLRQKKNRQLYGMFEKAGVQAVYAGAGLRRVITSLQTDSLQIVAHSLGCKVAQAALFNLSHSEVPTPQQQSIRVVYLAPALQSSDFYSNFLRRDLASPDNYHFLVVYNENDFVLKKKDPKTGLFGPGVQKYGATSLGCNRKGEAVELKRRIDSEFPSSDLRLLDKSSLGKHHSLRFYTRDNQLKEVDEFLYGK